MDYLEIPSPMQILRTARHGLPSPLVLASLLPNRTNWEGTALAMRIHYHQWCISRASNITHTGRARCSWYVYGVRPSAIFSAHNNDEPSPENVLIYLPTITAGLHNRSAPVCIDPFILTYIISLACETVVILHQLAYSR